MLGANDTPTDEQNRAIAAIDDWYQCRGSQYQVFYLMGEAGVGKSFTASFALRHLRDKRRVKRVSTVAIAGKAVHELRKKGIEDASTAHSALYEPREDPETGEISWVLRTDGPLQDADLIIVDEGRMVGSKIGHDLLMTGKKLLVMADPFQLQPVEGEPILTSREPDFTLREFHRQAWDSPIIRIAHGLRQGRLPRRFGSVGNVHVMPLTSETQRLAYRAGTQAICGVHRVRHTYTRRIRSIRGHENQLPVQGEPVICRQNNRDRGLYNGMLGVSQTPAGAARPDMKHPACVRLDFLMEEEAKIRKDVPVHPWLFGQHYSDQPAPKPRMSRRVELFDWSYLLTCHQAQGSGFSSVTVIDDSGVFRARGDRPCQQFQWLYTAVTRSSDELFLLLRSANLDGSWRLPDVEMEDWRAAA